MKLSIAIERYLEWKASHTTRAYINYRMWLVKLRDMLGDKDLEEVTLEDIGKYQMYLNGKYQPYTIQLAMVAVHNFFKFQNLMKIDCLMPHLIRVPKAVARPRPVVYEDDYQKILDLFKNKNSFIQERNELIIRMLWDTGVRISELVDINVADIEDAKRECMVRTRKTNRMRQVFWTPETNAVLLQYLQKREVLSNTSALFLGFSSQGTPGRLTARSMQRIILEIVEKAGIEKHITPHSFRHGKAHRIIKLGGNIKHVGAILGHSETNPAAAMRYLQFNNMELRQTAQRFNKPINVVKIS